MSLSHLLLEAEAGRSFGILEASAWPSPQPPLSPLLPESGSLFAHKLILLGWRFSLVVFVLLCPEAFPQLEDKLCVVDFVPEVSGLLTSLPQGREHCQRFGHAR